MSHTKEPWKVVNRGDEQCSDIDAKGPEGWGGDVTIAMNIGNDTARRIVACVNACAGISTDRLEDLGKPLMNYLFGADEHAANLVKQRDELLAALETVNESAVCFAKNEYSISADAISKVENAIASAKGSAS